MAVKNQTPQQVEVVEATEKVTAQNLKNSLKFNSEKVADAIAVTINGTTYTIKDSIVNMLIDEETGQGYVSFGKFSSIVKLDDDTNVLTEVLDDVDCTELRDKLAPKVAKAAGTKSIAVLDEATVSLLDQLKAALPAGTKLVMTDGVPKVVKTRNRKKGTEKVA